ncbi:hypothetical protein WAK64_19855 [Bacillus spongiae]|uniref:Uncharacterized protein n=1 Tax=Bacillus spongiae TaxID=2683610 RepID=A0ABU8HJN6_9BACI
MNWRYMDHGFLIFMEVFKELNIQKDWLLKDLLSPFSSQRSFLV